MHLFLKRTNFIELNWKALKALLIELRKNCFAAANPGTEDDGFGDFLQGPTPPLNTPQTPTADPLIPQGHLTSPGQSPQQPPPKDEGFGDFLKESHGEGQGNVMATGDGKTEVEPVDVARKMPRKEEKTGKFLL